MVLLGIIIPFLVFFISMNTTYAFFTATATKKESTTTTATVQITFKTDGVSTVSASTESGEAMVIPGDTLTLTGSLTNVGSADAYAIMEFIVTVQKTGSTDIETVCKKYYTFVDSTLTEITGTENNYSTNAGIITSNTSKHFTSTNALTFTFTGATYDNSYKNATMNYYINASAIQTANLASTETESAKVATNLLMEKF